jgi:hypothetical protein
LSGRCYKLKEEKVTDVIGEEQASDRKYEWVKSNEREVKCK